jgi:prepilin peptidase CpaA
MFSNGRLPGGRSHFVKAQKRILMPMIAELFLLVVLPVLLAVAAGWDLASFTIPNWLQLALIASFAVFVFLAGISAPALGGHILAAFIALAVGFTLFALGYVGGGDAKLFAVIALWFGIGDLANFALVASLMGGGLTLAMITLRRMPLPASFSGQAWIARLHDEKAGIPYGVALAAGALAILPHTAIFRMAAGL